MNNIGLRFNSEAFDILNFLQGACGFQDISTTLSFSLQMLREVAEEAVMGQRLFILDNKCLEIIKIRSPSLNHAEKLGDMVRASAEALFPLRGKPSDKRRALVLKTSAEQAKLMQTVTKALDPAKTKSPDLRKKPIKVPLLLQDNWVSDQDFSENCFLWPMRSETSDTLMYLEKVCGAPGADRLISLALRLQQIIVDETMSGNFIFFADPDCSDCVLLEQSALNNAREQARSINNIVERYKKLGPINFLPIDRDPKSLRHKQMARLLQNPALS